MKIVITGAAGYIGSRLSPLLSKMGFDVVAFDNLMYDQGSMVYPSLKGIEFYKSDMTQWSPNLVRHIHEANVLIPLAAIVGAPACAKVPVNAKTINFDWFEQLLSLKPSLKIIYPNTSSGYGDAGEITCTETAPTRPLSGYGTQKQNTEDLLMNQYKENTISFRLATVFGWSWRPRLDLLVNNLTYTAYKDKHLSVFGGEAKRNYIHIADICSAFVKAVCDFDKMAGEIYNLGNGIMSCPKSTLIDIICKATGATFSIDDTREDPDKRNFILDSSKLEKTGWACSYDLKDGIEELLRYYKFLQPIDLSELNSHRFRNY